MFSKSQEKSQSKQILWLSCTIVATPNFPITFHHSQTKSQRKSFLLLLRKDVSQNPNNFKKKALIVLKKSRKLSNSQKKSTESLMLRYSGETSLVLHISCNTFKIQRGKKQNSSQAPREKSFLFQENPLKHPN